ncbi:hypothetical protein [Niabella hibiscisoli]|uniref:hypothetical protein n=1 Tax=Niabella hibiscisoli TaxID=1825928 RepID=UPI001F1171F7|nr:hypothetical protein [Niabella hibiscisoli]MCH5718463.1 hypothetical protein [Niabella hibiscisoli]
MKDKFGMSWQIVPQKLMILTGQEDKEKAKKVTDALMQMQKIDIDKLSAISAA